MDKSRYDDEERAEHLEKDDYWGQVRRTINGKPVSKDQIDQNQYMRSRFLISSSQW